MTERRTTSILQRVPVILAVTAASYGLAAQVQGPQTRRGGEARQSAAAGATAAALIERLREGVALRA